MAKRRINYLFTLALPVIALGGIAGFLNNWGSSSAGGVVFDTTTMSRGQIRKLVSTSGPVRALVTVSVGSQLSGQIQTVTADFNTEVQPGNILAALDKKTFTAKVAQAEADLGAAQAALINQQAALAKSQAVLLAAETNVERQKGLADKRLTAQSTFETAVRDRDVAKADIDVVNAQITSARATIAQRQAALDQTKVDLERADIRSPIAGTVISRTVDPGQTVAASLQSPELFKIAQDLSRIRIEAQVNEADVGSVAEGNDVNFTVDAYPERQFDGRVTQVRLAATELNNVVTYTVIIEADNEDRRLFPGMTANVMIESARRDGVLRLSNDAMRFKPRGAQAAGSDDDAGGQGRGQGSGERGQQRMLERLKEDLRLTADQEKILRDSIAAAAAETPPPGAGADRDQRRAARQKMQALAEKVLAPTLSDEQRPLFARWKQGRQNARMVPVFILAADGTPQRRMVRAGIADDQFTEVLGGQLKDDDKVIVKSREVK